MILFYELSLLARAARQNLASVTANLNTLIVTANQTAGQARDASEQAKLAAIEQRAYWSKTSLETYKTMASVRLTIVRTDRSLNDVLVPQLGHTLEATTELSRSAAANLARMIEGLQPTLGNMGRASAAAADASEEAAKTMADPRIGETLGNLEETSKRAADTADQTAQAMGNLNAATRDVAAYVHRETAPVRGTWNIVKELLGLAYQSRGALGK